MGDSSSAFAENRKLSLNLDLSQFPAPVIGSIQAHSPLNKTQKPDLQLVSFTNFDEKSKQANSEVQGVKDSSAETKQGLLRLAQFLKKHKKQSDTDVQNEDSVPKSHTQAKTFVKLSPVDTKSDAIEKMIIEKQKTQLLQAKATGVYNHVKNFEKQRAQKGIYLNRFY